MGLGDILYTVFHVFGTQNCVRCFYVTLGDIVSDVFFIMVAAILCDVLHVNEGAILSAVSLLKRSKTF